MLVSHNITSSPNNLHFNLFESEENKKSEKVNSCIKSFWKERPLEINEKINKAFNKIKQQTESEWGIYNGSEHGYEICEIKEFQLMRKIILDAQDKRKEFYLLDIGAGNFQFGRGLAKYLNSNQDVLKDVKVHIIGIRGETNEEEKELELGQFRLYQFGGFKVEELIDQFKKRGLDLVNRVDLVVSRWTLRHLVDPLGTLAQAYDLLYPKTGILLADGFFFLYDDENERSKIDFDKRMSQLFLEIGAPFLTHHHSLTCSLNQFVLKKPNNLPCPLQKEYLKVEEVTKNLQIGSEAMCSFKSPKEFPVVKTPPRPPLGYEVLGDEDLYKYLNDNDLFKYKDLGWGPIQEQRNSNTAGISAIASRCLQDGWRGFKECFEALSG